VLAYEQAKGKPYAETFRCPGGALCLDFCNSGLGGQPRRQEWIDGFAELIDWLETATALSEKHAARLRAAAARSPQAAHALWVRSIGWRDALSRVLLARTQGRPAAREDLRVIDTEYARTAPFARLAASDGGFEWTLDETAGALDAALRPLVESAVSLLTSPKLARLGRCGNSTCYWLFLDETKNRSRRWCEMASCGNLMKVRRHRAKRHRSA
jgi:predicted RNA-binding Zn ribbon-like protein